MKGWKDNKRVRYFYNNLSDSDVEKRDYYFWKWTPGLASILYKKDGRRVTQAGVFHSVPEFWIEISEEEAALMF